MFLNQHKLCTLLLFMVFAMSSMAQSEVVTLTWLNPVENTDGSVFDAVTELKETRVTCNLDGAPVPAVFIEPGFAISIDIDFVPGRHECTASSVHINGNESGPSNMHVVTVDLPPTPNPTPNSPTGLKERFGPAVGMD